MRLIRFCFERAKIILLIFSIILLIGSYLATKLPVNFFPNIPTGIFSVTTKALGATSLSVDQEITQPFTRKFSRLPDLASIQAMSFIGYSWVDVQFLLSPHIDHLINLARSSFNSTKQQMPAFADTPNFRQLRMTDFPVRWLGVQNPKLNREELTHLTKKNIIPELEQISSINHATLEGAIIPEIKVYLNPEKMAATGTNISDIFHAFNEENFILPAGFVKHADQRYPLNLNMKKKTLPQFRSMIIKQKKGKLIRLKQVASVVKGTALPKSVVQVNNHPAVGLSISLLPSANTIKTIPEILKKIKTKILAKLPPGTTIIPIHNNYTLIKDMLNDLSSAVIYSIILACLVVLFFMQSIRTTLIVAITIPVSLATAFCALYFGGYSLNIVTLMDFALLVGVAVDDSVVVIESLHARVKATNTQSIAEQCIKATRAISLPVLTTTLTIVALGFSGFVMSGTLKIMFSSFATVLFSGVICSYLVAICVTPYLYSIFLSKPTGEKNRYQIMAITIIKKAKQIYGNSLRAAIRFRLFLIFLLISLFIISYILGKSIGFSLFPKNINYQGINISYRINENATFKYNLKKLNIITSMIDHIPDTQATYAKAGYNHIASQGSIYVLLKPAQNRQHNSSYVIKELRNNLAKIPGLHYTVSGAKPTDHMRQPLKLAITGPNLKKVEMYAREFAKKVKNHPKLGRFTSDLRPDQMQYKLHINNNLAQSRGISSKEIAKLSALFGGGINAGTYIPKNINLINNGKPINIALFPQPRQSHNLNDLNHIYLRTPSGKSLILGSIAHFSRVSQTPLIIRVGTQYAIRFWSTPSMSLSNALNQAKKITASILPAGYKLIVMGGTKQSLESMRSTGMGALLLLLIFYIIFSAQFNSLLQPIIILVAQPLAIVGVILALATFHMTISIYAMIGILLLIGLVAKNSILLVDRANQIIKEQTDWLEGLYQACCERMIPIVMTSLTIMLAMLPVYIAQGQSARGQSVLATTIIFGVLFSTTLSLYIVPVLYYYLHSKKKHRRLALEPSIM
jgi:hydrophobic/amphiphilic exporter-1 (mainly G- bacteria), HAE1 family